MVKKCLEEMETDEWRIIIILPPGACSRTLYYYFFATSDEGTAYSKSFFVVYNALAVNYALSRNLCLSNLRVSIKELGLLGIAELVSNYTQTTELVFSLCFSASEELFNDLYHYIFVIKK